MWGILEIRSGLRMPATEWRTARAREVRVVQDAQGKKHLVGYAAVFNQPSQPLSTAQGVRFIETIRPGAFRDALASNSDIPLLHSHDHNKVLARTGEKTLALKEDAKGLAFDATLADTTLARDLIGDVQHGNIDGMSFGFDAPEDEWAEGDELPQRSLITIPLGEVSATPFPAYPQTSVDVRSIDRALARLNRGASRTQKFAGTNNCLQMIQAAAEAGIITKTLRDAWRR